MAAIPFTTSFETAHHNYCNGIGFASSILTEKEAMVSNQNYGIQPNCHAIQPAMTNMNYGIQPFYNTIQPTSTMTDIKNSELMLEHSNKSAYAGTVIQDSAMEYRHCYGLQPCFSTMQPTSNIAPIKNEQTPEIMNEYSLNTGSTYTPTLPVVTETGVKYQTVKDFERLRYCQCDICQKTFLDNENLRRHRRTHGSMECYRCMVCGKFYLSKNKLAKHFKTHSTTASTPLQNCVISEI